MSPAARRRVLIVDDSAFSRKVVREILSASPEIEVVGSAVDGLEALEKIAALAPDVVTLDLLMPNLDGLGVLRALESARSPTRVVVVSMSSEDSELALEALALGAVELVCKPSSLATARLYEMGPELVRKVLGVSGVRGRKDATLPAPPVATARAWVAARTDLIVIGTSTGGPQALTRILAALPADLPVPIAMALHIPVEYTNALARRLDGRSALTVVEASEGLELVPGLAVLARGGSHLAIRRERGALRAHITHHVNEIYTPSVDVLFRSAAEAVGSGALGVVLTGMGDDGLSGCRAISAAGGQILVESESSCVVYGMPRVVSEAGLAIEQVPLAAMAAAIVRRLTP